MLRESLEGRWVGGFHYFCQSRYGTHQNKSPSCFEHFMFLVGFVACKTRSVIHINFLMRQMRLREVRGQVQGHIVNKVARAKLECSSFDPASVFLFVLFFWRRCAASQQEFQDSGFFGSYRILSFLIHSFMGAFTHLFGRHKPQSLPLRSHSPVLASGNHGRSWMS